MNNTALPTTTNQLDASVLNLMSGIRQTETGGKYDAQGKSGEYGAYQYTAPTWKGWAAKYLGDANADWTDPANQNKVAYARISDLKSQGLNPTQIASMWNSGNPDPTGNVGTNKYGVSYNTPQYVANVLQAAQQAAQARRQAQQNQGGGIVPVANASTGQVSPGNQPGSEGDWLDKSANFFSSIFPGKQVGEAIGTLGGYLYTKAYDAIHKTNYSKYYNLDAPTPLQTLGDIAQGALMVGAGAPEGSVTKVFGASIPALARPASAIGRIGENAALGTLFGASGAVASGNNQDITSQAALGGILGGAGGILGETLSKASSALPKRLFSSALPQLDETLSNDYLGRIKFGTMDSMVSDANKAVNSLDNRITSILTDPQYGAMRISGSDIESAVLNRFPNYDTETIFSKLKSQVPTQAATISRLENGESLTLEQANDLRKATDKVTFKGSLSYLESPEVKDGKDLAAAVRDAISNAIKGKILETKDLFLEHMKNTRLLKALKYAAKTKSGKSVVTFKDLYGVLTGAALGGIPGSIAGAAVENLAARPANRLMAAKLANTARPLGEVGAGAIKAAGALVPGMVEANQAKKAQ